MKPTQLSVPAGSINQIPGTAVICGDLRVTPFYDIHKVRLVAAGCCCCCVCLLASRGAGSAFTQASGGGGGSQGCFSLVGKSRHKQHPPQTQTKNKKKPKNKNKKVIAAVRGYVDDINANPDRLARGQRGPHSKYELPEEGLRGRLELKVFDNIGKGVACNLDSPGARVGGGGGVWWCVC
jgi:hypothetical protein